MPERPEQPEQAEIRSNMEVGCAHLEDWHKCEH